MLKFIFPRQALVAFSLCAVLLLAFPAHVSGQGHGGGEAEFERFITMDLVSAPIINRSRVRGRVELSLILEVLDREKAGEVQNQLPRIHASFVRVTQQYMSTITSLTQPMDLEFLIRSMQRALDQVLDPGAADVLVQQAVYKR